MINIVMWLKEDKNNEKISMACARNSIRIVESEFENISDFLNIFSELDTNIDVLVMRESYLVSCIHLILCQIFESAAEIDVVSSIKNYIDANYMYNIKISDIAKDVNLDKKYLARIYKLKTGYMK